MKKILMIIFFAILFTAIIVFALTHMPSQSNNLTGPFIPNFIFATPTPFNSSVSLTPVSKTVNYTPIPENMLHVVKTNPEADQTNIAVNSPIIITFNKNFSASEFSFSIKPAFDYTTSMQGNSYIITPTSPLSPGTLYEYFIDYIDGQNPDVFMFTTTGITPDIPTANDNFRQTIDNSDLKYAPDVYLSNKIEDNAIPYNDFTITYDYTSVPEGHFYFNVTFNSQSQDKSKQDFNSWLKSIGLSDQQIQSLDIRYQ